MSQHSKELDDDNFFAQELEAHIELCQWEDKQDTQQKDEMAYRRIMNNLDGIDPDPELFELEKEATKLIKQTFNEDLNFIEDYKNDMQQVENEEACSLCGGVNFIHPPEYNYEAYEVAICPECSGQDWKRIDE